DFAVTELHILAAGYFVRRDHPLSRGATIEEIDLRGYPLASAALGAQREFLRGEAGGLITCEDCGALKQVALATDAILLGADLSMQPELGEGRLVALPERLMPGARSRVGVVRRKG